MATNQSPPNNVSPLLQAEPMLSLSHEMEIPKIVIGDRNYGLKRREALTLREDAKAHVIARRLLILDSTPLDEAVATDIAGLRDQLCRLVVVGMTDEEHVALSDYHRGEIVRSFFLLRWAPQEIEIMATLAGADPSSTSANSSHDSTGSIPEPAIG